MQFILSIFAIFLICAGYQTAKPDTKITDKTPNNLLMVVIFNALSGSIQLTGGIIALCIIWTS